MFVSVITVGKDLTAHFVFLSLLIIKQRAKMIVTLTASVRTVYVNAFQVMLEMTAQDVRR